MRDLFRFYIYHYFVTILVAASTIFVLLGLNYTGSFIDRAKVLDNLRLSIEADDFSRTIELPFGGDRAIPRFSGNDCRILSSLILPYASRAEEALSPRVPAETPLAVPLPDNGVPRPPCLRLMQLAGMADRTAVETYSYHRYLHGFRTMALLLSPLMRPGDLGKLTLAASYGMLATLLAMAGWKCLGRREPSRGLSFLCIAATFLVFYGIPVYGRYFTFGFADLIVYSFLLFSLLFPLCRLPVRSFTVAVALFGSLTAIFEFLTGGIPIGLAILLGMVALGNAPDRNVLFHRAFHGVVVFTLAVLTCFALKMALVFTLAGAAEIELFMAALDLRTGSSFLDGLGHWERMRAEAAGFDVAAMRDSAVSRILYVAFRLGEESFRIAHGSETLGVLLLGGSLLAAAALLARELARRQAGLRRAEAAVLLGSLLVLAAWYLSFVNHTVLHAVWMVRPLVWLPALTGVLAVRLAYGTIPADPSTTSSPILTSHATARR